MENLLDYLIYALCGYDYVVKPMVKSRVNNCRQWMLSFGHEVSIILDEHDINVLKNLCYSRPLDDEERARYEELFLKCC